MNYEQINTNTENAISAMRAEVEHGLLKKVSECWSYVAGYAMTRPIMAYNVWEAIMELFREGKISY